MRIDLNVLFGIFQNFFQIDFGDAELTRGVKLGLGQRDAAPLQFPGDADAVSRVCL